MSNYETMSRARFATLMNRVVATRANRGRPGRRGLPAPKRVIGPRPGGEDIIALLFYKESYDSEGNKIDAPFNTDAKAREFMGTYNLKTFAPIENTPSFRRIRINKAANFDPASLRTFRIEGHEDVLVITGRRYTPEEIASLGIKAAALQPRKRTLAAAGVRVSAVEEARETTSETKLLSTVAKLERNLATYIDRQARSVGINASEMRVLVAAYREGYLTGGAKTEDQIKKMGLAAMRQALVDATRVRLANARKDAATVARVTETLGVVPPPAPATPPTTPPATSGGGRGRAPPEKPTADDIRTYVDLWNGDAKAGEQPLRPKAGAEPVRLTIKAIKAAFKDSPREEFLARIEKIRSLRAQQNAEEAEMRERVMAAAAGATGTRRRTAALPTPAPIEEEALLSRMGAEEEAAVEPAMGLTDAEIAEMAKLTGRKEKEIAAQVLNKPRADVLAILSVMRTKAAAAAAPASAPSRTRTPARTASSVPEAPAVPAAPGVPEFSLTADGKIASIPAGGKETDAVNRALREMMSDLGITSADEKSVVVNLIIARALSGQDALERVDAFRDIYDQVKTDAGVKSLAAIARDATRLRGIDDTLRRKVGPMAYVPVYGGYPVGPRSMRGVTSEEPEESQQAMRREEAGPLLRTNRRVPTLRNARGSNRFKKVREAQAKHETLVASLPAIRRDLGLVRRRLTLLKGKRTAQAKYARDQLQAEATRLMRRIEKVEAQVDRAAAAVARAVKAANPKVKQKVRPLKQPKAKKPKATKKRKATTRRSR